MEADQLADALPTPDCPEGLGSHCPGPFETVTSSCRPGEIDATIRCQECGAACHLVLDDDGRILSDAELAAIRAGLNVIPDGAQPPSAVPDANGGRASPPENASPAE